MPQPDAAETRSSLWFIAPVFGGASEVWLYRQATGMTRFSVRVLASRRVNEEDYPAQGVVVESSEGAGKLPDSTLGRALHYLSNHRYGFFRGTVAEREWWVERLERERPDVALCHYGSMAVRMLPLLKQRQVPVVAHFNGFDLSKRLRNPSYRRRLQRAVRKLDGAVVVANYMKEWLLQNGLPGSSIRLIPYGVPLADWCQADQVASQPCRFLAIGRFVEKKRPDLTVRAFARSAAKAPDASLVMIGDGPLRAQCEEIARTLGVADRVEFLGACSSDSVKVQIASSSAFVQHSVVAASGDSEGWPVAIAEAASAGLPVISTRHASIPEQVEDGVTGLLCDELAWEEMSDHMIRLATDHELRVSMGRAARAKYALLDASQQIQKLEDFLLEVSGSAAKNR